MDVNSVNGQNNINNVGPLSQQSSQGIQANQGVVNGEKDASNVLINDIEKGNRSSFSYALTNLNEGIATTKITQKALDKQSDDLKVITEKLDTLKSDQTTQEEKVQLKNDIQNILQSFNETANNTKFNNQNLLNQEEGNYLNIVTPNASFSIELPNTAKVSNDLVNSFNQNDITTEFGNEVFATSVNQSAQKVNNASRELQNVEKNIETVARDAIQEQINSYNANASTNDVNFGKETVDFTKTSVSSQIGYLVSSQANIVQEQSVRLLS